VAVWRKRGGRENWGGAMVVQITSNQIKIYIAPYVHEDSEALGGWITCSRLWGIKTPLRVRLNYRLIC